MPFSLKSRNAQVASWFILMVLLVFAGEILGYAACLLTEEMPPHPAAWAAFIVVALIIGGVATVLLDWLVLATLRQASRDAAGPLRYAVDCQELQVALANRIEQQRRLRHDIRGVLSPVLLTADRLVNHADPAVKRSGEILMRTVDRATALLTEAAETAANPPAGP